MIESMSVGVAHSYSAYDIPHDNQNDADDVLLLLQLMQETCSMHFMILLLLPFYLISKHGTSYRKRIRREEMKLWKKGSKIWEESQQREWNKASYGSREDTRGRKEEIISPSPTPPDVRTGIIMNASNKALFTFWGGKEGVTKISIHPNIKKRLVDRRCWFLIITGLPPAFRFRRRQMHEENTRCSDLHERYTSGERDSRKGSKE